MLQARERGLKQSFDWALVAVYLLLVLIGWVNIYSAGHTAETGSILDFGTRAGKQFIWILTSLGLAGFILSSSVRACGRGWLCRSISSCWYCWRR